VNPVKSLLIAGVGGQGIILASEIISEVLLEMGYDVKKNEIHGMAQRGGSVTSQIRYGDHVYSPKIPFHAAQLILALEYVESARFLELLAPEGKILASRQTIIPTTVSIGGANYPHDLESFYQSRQIPARFIPAHQIADQLGNPKTSNLVMLGFLNQEMRFDHQLWYTVIKRKVKPKFIDLNLQAFERGFEFTE